METINTSILTSTRDGIPLAYNREYFTIFFRYVEPPYLILGAFTNFLCIIGLGENLHYLLFSVQQILPIFRIIDFYFILVRARHSFSPSIVFYYLTMAIADFISGCSYFYCVFAKETIPLWLGDPHPPLIASTLQLPTKVWYINLLYYLLWPI